MATKKKAAKRTGAPAATKRASARPRSKPRIRPVWERGYFSHSYWAGKKKMGTVKLGPKEEWDGVYRWEAGHHYGEANSLAAAKRAVEQAVDFGVSQMGLFEA
jgi:hypothetical protein